MNGVKLEQLDLHSVETSLTVKCNKLKNDMTSEETNVEAGHEELDAASLPEHEEFTNMKNIAIIELGRYEIETWHFPPFLWNIMIHRSCTL
ncbi:hypothetical protein PTKIN_Ptkin09bG0048000 [Pterospermum kingtungense]